MSEVTLTAEPRTEFGKGAARRLRRAHRVPAVLYGHGSAPVHVSLDGHATMLALKHTNALLSISLADGSQLALTKDVQRNPTRGDIEHVDLLIVRRGEKVTVDVPVHVVGTPAPETMVISEVVTLSIEVEATKIPVALEVSVDGAQAGTQIKAADVVLPTGAEAFAADPDLLVVLVTGEEPEEEPEEAEAEAAAPAEEADGA